jgi:hypothetical protein
MSFPAWICPYCGAENYSDPELSIVRPCCRQCSQPYITAGDLEHKRGKELKELRGMLTDAMVAIHNLTDQQVSLMHDMDALDQRIHCANQDFKMYSDEIKKWETMKIYLSAPDLYERAERAKKDPYQRGLKLCQM